MSASPTIQELDPITVILDSDRIMRELEFLNKVTARVVLDKVDQLIPPGDSRQALRKRLLDQLANNQREMQKWLSQEALRQSNADSAPSV